MTVDEFLDNFPTVERGQTEAILKLSVDRFEQAVLNRESPKASA